MAEVSIVGYGIGNTGSIGNMLRKLRIEAEVVANEKSVLSAKRLILPGIGAFDACVSALDGAGVRAAVLEFAATQRPLLGICVGMQMLTLASEEGSMPGLGLIPARTGRFADATGLRIPHMGWNTVRWSLPDHPLARGLSDDSRFYFVHSYRVICESPANCLATCAYGGDFCAAIVSGNVAGVQFHPEKSHRFGLKLLSNFAAS
ncbi:MAG: imidazole glycerol phosphate synthase subunit HisH [Steroidobacteraceae bacterium]